MQLAADFISLFYPQICAACDGELLQGEEHICINCIISLPYTGYETQAANLVEQSFWGRVEIESAAAFLHFRKGNKTQHIMHRIKYKGEKELAQYIGGLAAQQITNNVRFTGLDAIIPVPMHKAKQRKRGFNQSEWFAKGLAQKLDIPVLTNVLLKTTATASQTSKTRWERWLNLEEVLTVNHPETIENKHILIVDDTLTTGATIEHCAQALKKAVPCKISVATMAVAD